MFVKGIDSLLGCKNRRQYWRTGVRLERAAFIELLQDDLTGEQVERSGRRRRTDAERQKPSWRIWKAMMAGKRGKHWLAGRCVSIASGTSLTGECTSSAQRIASLPLALP